MPSLAAPPPYLATPAHAAKTAVLVVGPPDLAFQVKLALQAGEPGVPPVLVRTRLEDAVRPLQECQDIGVVLLLWDKPDCDGLAAAVRLLSLAQGKNFRKLLVRMRAEPPAAIKDALWRLGVADLAFNQKIPSCELSDSIAVALRDHVRHHALAAASVAAGAFAAAPTLRDLAQLALQAIHRQGIGRCRAFFCYLATSPMILAGTGLYGGLTPIPLDKLSDRSAAALVTHAIEAQQSQYEDDALAIYLKTPDDHEACLFLALIQPLNAWEHGFLDVLTDTIAMSIDQIQLSHRLLRTQHATITTMATLAEYRDVDTGEHVARVARAATEIAMALAERGVPGVDEKFIDQIGLASILHDVGKIAIPETILQKPGPLDPAERAIMQTHVDLGRDILLRAAKRSDHGELLRQAAEIAACHHEKYDGSGYPAGLSGQAIPLTARIVALVDVFDALTSLRPYKAAWPIEDALALIRSESGKHFDPVVVEAFLSLEERKKTARFIEWSERMSVGNADLDHDHKRLIAIINRLWLASGDGNRRVVEFILDDLVHYTEFHFEREERLLKAAGYTHYDRHYDKHQVFCRHIEEIRWEYFQGIRDEPRNEILQFLTSWLQHHILQEDMAYRDCLANAACELTAE